MDVEPSIVKRIFDRLDRLPQGMLVCLAVIGGLLWLAYAVVPTHIHELGATQAALEQSHRSEREADRRAFREEREAERVAHREERAATAALHDQQLAKCVKLIEQLTGHRVSLREGEE